VDLEIVLFCEADLLEYIFPVFLPGKMQYRLHELQLALGKLCTTSKLGPCFAGGDGAMNISG
jgi:hypothetical protein